MNLRVAIYSRVSTDEQAREGYSLTVQREFLENYARQQGWEVIYPEPGRVYQDDGFSGGTLQRPALQRLLRDAKAKRFDLVLVYKLDRFSRRLKDLLTVIDDLEAWGVAFKSATEPLDNTTSSGKLMLQQLGSFAEFERARIAERIFPGMVKSVSTGHWHGARYAPYGYSYNREKKVLEVISEEAKLVRLIYSMYLAGGSTAKIAGHFYKQGYKSRTGGTFGSKLVLDILKNPLYVGTLIWNKRHYDKRQKTRKGFKSVGNPAKTHVIAQGKHEPIISKEEFDLVQQKLAANRKGRFHRISTREYPASGILFCKRCSHKYSGTSGTSNHQTKERRRWYRCTALVQHDIHCSNPAIKAEALEAQIFTILEVLMKHQAIKTGRIDQLVQSHAEINDERLKDRHRMLKEDLKTNLAKQSKLTDAYLDGAIAKEVFKEQSDRLRAEETQITLAITKLEMELIERERSAEYQQLLQQVVDDFDGFEGKLDVVRKKELLRLIFKKVLIDGRKIISFELYEPFQRMYNEVLAELNTSIDKVLEELCRSECILVPTAGRWHHYYTNVVGMLRSLGQVETVG